SSWVPGTKRIQRAGPGTPPAKTNPIPRECCAPSETNASTPTWNTAWSCDENRADAPGAPRRTNRWTGGVPRRSGAGVPRAGRPQVRRPIARRNEANREGPDSGSGDHVADHGPVDVGEAEVAARVAVGQAGVVQPQQVEDGGVDVVDVRGVLGRGVAVLVRDAVAVTARHPAAGGGAGEAAAGGAPAAGGEG